MMAWLREVRSNIVLHTVHFGSVVALLTVWTETGTLRYSIGKSARSNSLLSELLTITQISMRRRRTILPAIARICAFPLC